MREGSKEGQLRMGERPGVPGTKVALLEGKGTVGPGVDGSFRVPFPYRE